MRRIIFALMATIGFTATAQAGDHSAAAESARDMGTVIVFRGEDRKTRNLDYWIYADNKAIARLDGGEFVSVALPAGEYNISSNLSGSNAVTVVVNEGGKVFVNSELRKRNGTYRPQFEAVSQEVALTSLPTLAASI